MKKIAVLIYPYFSMQEISCLTDALAVWFEQSVDIFASTKEIIKSEDGFQCIANKTLDEFNVNEYACVIMPGMLNPLPALFDEKLISFLSSLKGKDILIAAICSSPMLLAKAGLLEDYKFTSGIWEEITTYLEFIPNENIVRKPVVKDKNLITADSFAFREFAAEVIRTLGIDECEGGIFNAVTREYTEEELTYRMGEEAFAEFLEEYRGYLK